MHECTYIMYKDIHAYMYIYILTHEELYMDRMFAHIGIDTWIDTLIH